MAEIAVDLVMRAIRERKAGHEPKLVDHLVTYSLVKRQSVAALKAD
jgi:hypothetical protein